jgi:ribosomal protein S18 acetylase RimI-like enzyme
VRETLLRLAAASDATAIAAIRVAARREAMPYLPAVHTEDEIRVWVAGRMLPHAVVWVAETDGEVAGYLALNGTALEHLYVGPHRQGRGIGNALLSKARELSPERLQLYALQRNVQARAFYEARGFVAVAFSDGAGDEETEPDVLYEWSGRA